MPFRQLSHRDIEIAADQRAKQHEHSPAGAEADAHVGITQCSDLKQHNQKDENSTPGWKRTGEGEANNGVDWRASEVICRAHTMGRSGQFCLFSSRPRSLFLAILTCPFNAAPLIKKVRRNVEF